MAVRPALLWCAALLSVPTVLAAVGTVWPGPLSVAAPAALAPTADPGPEVATEPVVVPVPEAPGTVATPDSGASAPTAQAPTADALPVAEQVAALVAASPVRFAADSAVLEGTAVGTVRAVAVLLAPEAVAVVLEGHVADTPGAGAQALSERRAAVVADALVAGGVDPSRITAVGRGATAPLESRAASRRVEFEIR